MKKKMKRIEGRKAGGKGRKKLEEDKKGGEKKSTKEGKKKGRKEKKDRKKNWDLVGIEPMPGLNIYCKAPSY